MADILIRGISLPEDELKYVSLWVYGDGRVYVSNNASAACSRKLQDLAVPLPEGHGRLIDADALIDALETQDYSCAPDTLEDWTPQDMTVAEIADITHATTIVPAEGGTEECSGN